MLWQLITLSIFLTIYSKNWIMFWIFLELNTFMFIFYLFEKKYSWNSSESAIIYFIMSFFSTFLILLSFLNNPLIYFFENSFLLALGLLIKMGTAPFHYWMIQISKNCSNNQFLMLMTIQKIIPIFILSNIFSNYSNIMLILMNIFFTYKMFQSNNIKSIIITSSLANNNWIICSFSCNIFLTMTYFSIYSLIVSQFMYLSMKLNLKNLNNMNKNINLYIIIFSMMGIPPLMGFYIKLISIENFIYLFSSNIMILLMISTMMIAYIYMKMIFIPTFNKKMFKKNPYTFTLSMNLIFPIFLFLI